DAAHRARDDAARERRQAARRPARGRDRALRAGRRAARAGDRRSGAPALRRRASLAARTRCPRCDLTWWVAEHELVGFGTLEPWSEHGLSWRRASCCLLPWRSRRPAR